MVQWVQMVQWNTDGAMGCRWCNGIQMVQWNTDGAMGADGGKLFIRFLSHVVFITI